jgi:hypothetical protein
MKSLVNRIRVRFNCVAALFLLCPLLITGCSEYNVSIVSPDQDGTFEEGDAITFSMTLSRKSIDSEAPDVIIEKGTVIQWKSNIDGELWNETIDQNIPASDHDDGRYASYDQQFSSSALSSGNHTITCSAFDVSGLKPDQLASASVIIHVASSPITTTTTLPGPTTSTSTTGGGDLSAAACDALNRIDIYAGEPELYGQDCYAKLYVNNQSDQYINVISCQYDTHVSTINGCGCSVFSPGANTYIIDGGWIAATMSDGSTRTRETTIVAATYSVEGCAWTCNELADGTLDAPLARTDVSNMNPCGSHAASIP